MALSVLPISKDAGIYGLYDSNSNVYIYTGTEKEMEDLKHKIEDEEQRRENKKNFEDLRSKHVAALMSTTLFKNEAEADAHLKTIMPYLYDV